MNAIAFQAAALCLEYPDEQWRARLPLLRAAADALPATALHRFISYADATPPGEATRCYVDTFDLRRRCCPYLTYYAFGDTRKRGMALLEFTTAYRTAGFAVASGELPDHLAVVCEFTAQRPNEGGALLTHHRAGLELLRLALEDSRSPYVHVVDTVRSVLPEPAPRDLAHALELARSGPPEEEVGLEPFEPAGGGRR